MGTSKTLLYFCLKLLVARQLSPLLCRKVRDLEVVAPLVFGHLAMHQGEVLERALDGFLRVFHPSLLDICHECFAPCRAMWWFRAISGVEECERLVRGDPHIRPSSDKMPINAQRPPRYHRRREPWVPSFTGRLDPTDNYDGSEEVQPSSPSLFKGKKRN